MLIYWFLPMILFLGIVTSYEDIKFGKIRNKWVVLAVAYGASVNTLLFYLNSVDTDYLIKFLINGLASLIAGFFGWHLGLWTAGDAKLFFGYSLLLPLNIYEFANFGFFPSFNILIFTFVPVTIFLAATILKETPSINYLNKIFKFGQLVRLFLFLFVISWPLDILYNIFNSFKAYLFGITLIFILYFILDKVLSSVILYLILLSIARIIFDRSIFLWQTWLHFLFLLILSLFLRFFLFEMAFMSFTREVKIKNLKEGMAPAEMIFRDGKIYKKRKIINYGLYGVFYEKFIGKRNLFEIRPKGLLQEEVNRLRKIETKLVFKNIKIHQTLNFAPFLFISVIFILLLNFYL